MKKKLLMLIITAFSICSFLYSNDLKVAAVQLKISENTYSSYNQFWIEMEEHVNTAVNTFHPDLIIFPEYTSVFPSITPYYDYLQEGETVEEIFLAISDS
ncbi:MAG: hypothetical protein GY756_14485, partial [bacterium]|nr:hypothetical protein [bacterium]